MAAPGIGDRAGNLHRSAVPAWLKVRSLAELPGPLGNAGMLPARTSPKGN